MRKTKYRYIRNILVSLMAIFLATAISGCSGSKQSASGALKDTQYCQFYNEFDEKVATADAQEQKELLEKTLSANDFPTNPASLKKDYETIIDGYELKEDGKYDINDQKIYKDASERIARHAIDNCDVLKSNSK